MQSKTIKFNFIILTTFYLSSLLGIYLTSIYNYLLFHSIVEFFSVLIAFGIFIITWNSQKYMNNNYLLFIGIAYLFVGIIDILHTLAYKGMGIFPQYNSNLPTQLWIASRYLESISLLTAFYFFKRKINPYYLSATFFFVLIILLTSIFYWKIFPDCYIETNGLTSFKIYSEIIISLIFLVSIFLLVIKKNNFEKSIFMFLLFSIFIKILSELTFTAYLSVYDFFNLIGHLLKVISFYLIYRAIIKTGFTKPFNLLFRNLEQTKQKYQNLVENLQDGIWSIDKDNNTTFVNPKMTEMLGYETEEMLGINMLSFIDKKDTNNAKKILIKIKKNEKNQSELKFIKKDSTKRYFSMEISPIFDKYGKYIGALAGIKDTTGRKNLEDSLKKNIENCEIMVEEKTKELVETQKELDKSKRLSDLGTLAATIAHELRNPLGVIQIAAYNIRKKRENLIIDKHIDNIEKKVLESAKIIDNLLNYSRLRMPVFEKVKLYEVLLESINSIKAFYKKLNIKIIIKVENIRNLIIQADPLQLKEVFYNILNNSFQAFIDKKGNIDISAKHINNDLLINFKDNGTGIKKEDIEMIFKPFFTRKSKGTGLGLTICKEIIELHDGNIDIESIYEKGTSITISLPITR